VSKKEINRMNKTRNLAGLAAVAATLLLAAVAIPSSAATPIAVELLTLRSELTDRVSGQLRIKEEGGATTTINMPEMSKVVTARITVQPGASFPWHTHAGPVLVTVAQGALVYVSSDDCDEHTYVAGEAFVDSGHGHVHTAVNRTSGETILYATFLQAPAAGPLTITEGVTPPEC
jgi:quercetin dioxygenase-like cupin family protein